jgi:two-component system sensor histidine kinase KdpD
MASAQGDRLRRLVEDMLAINQVGEASIPVHPELVSLDSVIDQAVDSVAGAEDLVTTQFPHSIPAVILDPVHVKRVLTNLVANAVKYGEDSPIDITTRVVRDDLQITVADHGPGLPGATAAYAFDAFTQLNRTEVDAYGGVGLGLSISQGLVEAMGGAITHDPTPGGGATFIITLPFRPHAVPGTGL